MPTLQPPVPPPIRINGQMGGFWVGTAPGFIIEFQNCKENFHGRATNSNLSTVSMMSHSKYLELYPQSPTYFRFREGIDKIHLQHAYLPNTYDIEAWGEVDLVYRGTEFRSFRVLLSRTFPNDVVIQLGDDFLSKYNLRVQNISKYEQIILLPGDEPRANIKPWAKDTIVTNLRDGVQFAGVDWPEAYGPGQQAGSPQQQGSRQQGGGQPVGAQRHQQRRAPAPAASAPSAEELRVAKERADAAFAELMLEEERGQAARKSAAAKKKKQKQKQKAKAAASQSQAGGSSDAKEDAPKPAPAQDDGHDKGIPTCFICPISKDIMSEPVLASDGYVYERKHIEAWMAKDMKSPVNGDRLPGTTLVAAKSIRASIMDWQEKRKNAMQ